MWHNKIDILLEQKQKTTISKEIKLCSESGGEREGIRRQVGSEEESDLCRQKQLAPRSWEYNSLSFSTYDYKERNRIFKSAEPSK